jgi:hypothetical protein
MTYSRRLEVAGRTRFRGALWLALTLAFLAAGGDVGAEGWGGITPGETTRTGVEGLYGRPSRERTMVDEGRTVAEWTYAEDRAPRGLTRMVIAYGLMVGDRFAPDVVRSLVLYPKPQVFTVPAISSGWGAPDAVGTEEATGRSSFHYRTRGLLIIFDKTGSWAELLLFGPRQPAGGS